MKHITLNVKSIFNNQKLLFSLIIFFTLLLRITIIHLFGDKYLQSEWAIIVNNLSNHGEFSFRSFENFYVPNIYMPPLYIWFLYSFKIFNLNYENYVILILYVQAIISSFSLIIFYGIVKNFFSKNLSLLLSIIFCFFPSYLYASSLISSISLYIFLLLIFIYFFLKITISSNFKLHFYLGIVAGLSLLLRGEFIFLFIISLFYLFFYYKNVPLKNILITILISLIVISPYLYRNVTKLNSYTIIKSLGFNLWKGNNPNSNVEGDLTRHVNEYGATNFQGELEEKINNIKIDKYYDINLDNLFLDEALNNIKTQPQKYFLLYIKKIFSFMFFDINSSLKNYYNIVHLLPLIFISVFSFFGLLVSFNSSKNLNFIIILFLSNLLIFSFFFILPRYNLIILPMQIILAGKLLDKFLKKF